MRIGGRQSSEPFKGRWCLGDSDRSSKMKKIGLSQSGIALIIVLWVLILLSVIVLEFCFSMRTELNTTRNFKEEGQLYFYARGGVQRAVAELIYQNDLAIHNKRKDLKTEESGIEMEWRCDGTPYSVPFPSGEAEVRVRSEAGRINLNGVPENILRKVIQYFLQIGEKRDIVVDSILDWRDPDDLHRLNGAENDYYRSLPEPYDCKNGDFDSVEELLLVRGITPELFYGRKGKDQEDQKSPTIGLRDIFTVFSTAANVDINNAPVEVLMALLGISSEVAKRVAMVRGDKEFSNLPELFQRVPEIVPFVTQELQSTIAFRSTTPYYTVVSLGKTKAGESKRGLECVVKIDKKEKSGYKVVMWKDIVL